MPFCMQTQGVPTLADLLVLCPITDDMRARLTDAFDMVELRMLDAPETWLDAHGSHIRFVLTDGHLGVAGAVLAALPNAQIISSYGVGYD
ncbi:MAG: hypothetical protein AAGF13_04330, partial [Pseudomonadota bacterium]